METSNGCLRTRRLCEYPGFDYETCERGLEKLLQADEEIFEKDEKIRNLQQNLTRAMDDLVEVERTADRSIKVMKERLEAISNIYRDGVRALWEITQEYATHKIDCDIWELLGSGRMNDMPENEICTCGWSEEKEMLDRAKKKGESEGYGEKEANELINRYITNAALAKSNSEE